MSETGKLDDKYRLVQWAVIIRKRINNEKRVDVWSKENSSEML